MCRYATLHTRRVAEDCVRRIVMLGRPTGRGRPLRSPRPHRVSPLRSPKPSRVDDPLDANYRQHGRWWSLAQARGLHRSAAIIRCRHGCCTVVLHASDLVASVSTVGLFVPNKRRCQTFGCCPSRSVCCPSCLLAGCEEALLYSRTVLSAALAAWRARPTSSPWRPWADRPNRSSWSIPGRSIP
jgi:hypothetical protein